MLEKNQRKEERLGAGLESGGCHTQSPTMTSGANSWCSSVADTGPLFSRLALCLFLASLDWEGGERRMEHEVAVMRIGCSSSSWCWASWRFTAIASAVKNVRSLALLFL